MASKALGKAFLSGLRVLGELQYIPASVRSDGKEIQQRCVLPCAINTGKTDAQGNSIRHTVRITAWGKLADSMAKSCPPGKELNVYCDIRSYKGQVFYANGQPVIDPSNGQPVMVNKISFNIDDMAYGDDSRRFIQQEIERGARHDGWDVPGTPAAAEWEQRKAQIKAVTFQPGMKTFGYAKVLAPRTGQMTTSAAGSPNQVNATFAGPGTAAAGATAGNGLPAGYTVDAQGNAVLNNQNQPAQGAASLF